MKSIEGGCALETDNYKVKVKMKKERVGKESVCTMR
jgi:hypothetical protein